MEPSDCSSALSARLGVAGSDAGVCGEAVRGLNRFTAAAVPGPKSPSMLTGCGWRCPPPRPAHPDLQFGHVGAGGALESRVRDQASGLRG
ncbi:hypothetical protein ACRAWF_20150, partial [Streptomyces sp. L7]